MDDYLNSISKPIEDTKPEEALPVETKPEETKPTEPPPVAVSPVEPFEAKMKGLIGKAATVEEVKEWFETAGKYQEVQGKYTAACKELEAYRVFADEAIDPMKYFASKEGLYRENAIRKYPNLEPAAAMKLAGRDAKDLSDEEALVLREVVRNAEVGLREDEARLVVLDSLKLASFEELDNLSPTERKLLSVKAKEARTFLAREQEAVRVDPEKLTPVDFLERHRAGREEAQNNAEKAYVPIIDGIISSVEGPVRDGEEELLTIKMEGEYKSKLKEAALRIVRDNRLEDTEENREILTKAVCAMAWNENAGRWIKAALSARETRLREEYDQKYANHKPVGLQQEKLVETMESMKEVYSSMVSGLPPEFKI